MALVFLPDALPAQPARRLEICREHRRYFRDGDRHVVLVGVSDRALFALWENDKGLSWRKYLADIADHRLNYVRHDVCSWGGLLVSQRYPAQFSRPAWPFARTGPGRAVDGKPRFDLARPDDSYFETRLKPFLTEARELGVYVELTLFEGLRQRTFSESVLAEANNINRLGLGPSTVTSDGALQNTRLMAIQRAYVDKVLEHTADFGNVIYEIANETGGRKWVAHWIDYIHGHPEGSRCLVSAGEQSTAFDPRRGANDVVVKHRGGGGSYATNSDVASHHEALQRYYVGKPVSHNEYFLFANRSTGDLNFPRKMMWADFTAGGHSNFFDFTYWRGTGRTLEDGESSRSPPAEILRGGKNLLEFLRKNEVSFWTMRPHDELAAVGGNGDALVLTFARPGVEYVSYVLGDGPLSITLELTGGPFTARWYDPKNGRFVTPERHTRGARDSVFASPAFKQDIVLHVRRSRTPVRSEDR